MSFRCIVCCNSCGRIQGILTPNDTIRNDGGGVFPADLVHLGWEEDADGKHACPFCISRWSPAPRSARAAAYLEKAKQDHEGGGR